MTLTGTGTSTLVVQKIQKVQENGFFYRFLLQSGCHNYSQWYELEKKTKDNQQPLYVLHPKMASEAILKPCTPQQFHSGTCIVQAHLQMHYSWLEVLKLQSFGGIWCDTFDMTSSSWFIFTKFVIEVHFVGWSHHNIFFHCLNVEKLKVKGRLEANLVARELNKVENKNYDHVMQDLFLRKLKCYIWVFGLIICVTLAPFLS
jgi:hypothetical protein